MIKINHIHIFYSMASLFVAGICFLGIMRCPRRLWAEFEWTHRDNNVIITKIIAGGSADLAGLQVNDIVAAIQNIPVQNSQQLHFILDSNVPGEVVELSVQRGQETAIVPVSLVSRFSRTYIASNLLLGFSFWLVGVFILFAKGGEKLTYLFFWGFMALAISISLVWPGFPYGYYVLGSLPALYLFVYPFVPPVILHFTLVYPERKRFLDKFKYVFPAIYAPTPVFIMLMEIGYLPAIRTLSLQSFDFYYQVYNVFRLFFLVYLSLSIAALVHSRQKAKTRAAKNKVQWILWGVVFGSMPFFMFWTLPHALGLSPLIPDVVGYFALLLVPVSLAFSIIRYQTFEIEIVVNRSIVYAIITILVVAFYLLSIWLIGFLFQNTKVGANHTLILLSMLIAAALFAPIKNKVQNLVDRLFYRVKYNYRTILRHFEDELSLTHTQDQVVEHFFAQVRHVLPVSKLALCYYKDHLKKFQAIKSRGIAAVDVKTALAGISKNEVPRLVSSRMVLAKKGRTEFEDYPELDSNPLFEHIKLELLIPIFVQDDLVGLLLVGPKKSGLRFREEDVFLLLQMAEQTLFVYERHRFQEQMILEQAEKKKLAELNQLKSDFIGHVSHELKTPLTSIQWSMENLLDGIPEELTPPIKKYVQSVHKSALILTQMIENLLDVTRIESNRILIQSEKLLVLEMVDDAIEAVRSIGSAKSIRFHVEIKKDMTVHADAVALQTILKNLLENAIKYSPEHSEIRLTAAPLNDDNIQISVQDQGVGIRPEKRSQIFDKFERLRSPKTERQKGLGLGLHIVKRLVELHGGEIKVKSQVDHGSTFSFTLPIG